MAKLIDFAAVNRAALGVLPSLLRRWLNTAIAAVEAVAEE